MGQVLQCLNTRRKLVNYWEKQIPTFVVIVGIKTGSTPWRLLYIAISLELNSLEETKMIVNTEIHIRFMRQCIYSSIRCLSRRTTNN